MNNTQSEYELYLTGEESKEVHFHRPMSGWQPRGQAFARHLVGDKITRVNLSNKKQDFGEVVNEDLLGKPCLA